MPTLNLPKGGGAIRGLDEKFNVNPATGTASLSVPLALSPGRGGFGPELALTYDSGGGNGVFGLGWSLGVPSITRKTAKGLPRYDDAEVSDTFILAGAEDLVPVHTEESGDWRREERVENGYLIQRYRPRTEGSFAHIERWRDLTAGGIHWRAVSKDNVTSIYGRGATARIADPNDPRRVFSWLLEESVDPLGNAVRYEYQQEDGRGVDPTNPSEGKRLAEGVSFAQRYLKRIRYGNIRSPDPVSPLEVDDWIFEVVFDYGDHDDESPTPVPSRDWTTRPDPFSSYRSGFEVRTYRVCRRVLVFHRFEELGPAPVLVGSTDLRYDERPHLTYLLGITQTGYGDDGQRETLPELTFAYTAARMGESVSTVEPEYIENLPVGVEGQKYQFTDLDGEGLNGVLSQQGGGWYYKRNLGDGQFGPLEAVGTIPSLGHENQPRLMDLDGDGRQEMVLLGGSASGFFERTEADGWRDFAPFRSVPNIDWNDPQLRYIDLDGDGLADLLLTEDDAFVWYPSEGEDGYTKARQLRKVLDEEDGPTLVFHDGTASVYLADMSGDGLTDLVRIRNGAVSYWPNLGYGRFGGKVSMTRAPRFDAPDQFDQRRVRLADVDGSGTTDVLYLGPDSVHIWFNESGNGWSRPRILIGFPPIDNAFSVSVVDLLGRGTSCLVWSSPLPKDTSRPLRYLNLMADGKPHLLSVIDNQLGAETRLHYAPSTKFYLEDRKNGEPWATRLPFPVHVVDQVEVRDFISNTLLVNRYSYHHGYFNGEEREFSGFGRVEQRDTLEVTDYNKVAVLGKHTDTPALVDEGFFLPPMLTKTWFHTGAYEERRPLSAQYATEYYNRDDDAVRLPDTAPPDGLTAREEREACRALRGTMLRQEVYALDGSDEAEHPYSVAEQSHRLRLLQPSLDDHQAVFYPYASETLTYHYERNPDDPRIAHELALEVDQYGHVTRSATVGYPRRSPAFAEQQERPIVYTETDLIHQDDDPAGYRIGLPAATRIYEVAGPAVAAPFPLTIKALNDALDGAAMLPFEDDLTSGADEQRVLSRTCTIYYDDAAAGPLPFGEASPRGLVYEQYQQAFTPGLLADAFGSDVDDSILMEGGYAKDVQGEGQWWVPSGRQVFDPQKFYQLVEVVDPFGERHVLQYDAHELLLTALTDPVGNTALAEYDYRTLQPARVTDPNGNHQAAAYDALGRLAASAVGGKNGEGDTLDDPTVRYDYDAHAWHFNQTPASATITAKEEHRPLADTRVQITHTYSDGLGREVLTKTNAEPGDAPRLDADGRLPRDDDGNVFLDAEDMPEGEYAATRWVGTGRTTYDNKGNPIKQYEPYFSRTPDYEDEEELVHWGVTPLLRYDPLSRLIRTDLPDGTFTSIQLGTTELSDDASREFTSNPWSQETWDQNDNVSESAWYQDINASEKAALYNAADIRAATLAKAHANTPDVAHLDTLGRVFRTEQILEVEATPFPTVQALDVQGNVLAVTDARGVTVLTTVYDMLRRPLHTDSVDAGKRWILPDVQGEPIHRWDERGHHFRQTYDPLRRPLGLYLSASNGTEQLLRFAVYGEQHPDAKTHNLRGQLYQQYDGAGVVTTENVDFKGNPLHTTRRLAQEYKSAPDWFALDTATNLQALQSAATPMLETPVFNQHMTYDALNRVIETTLPDDTRLLTGYNEAGLLETVTGYLRGAGTETMFVGGVDYNARGERTKISYGNDTYTVYEYDKHTFRLTTLTTTNTDNLLLQDLSYTYDPVGNIVQIDDSALPVVFGSNQQINPENTYVYDALYRLVKAIGREHSGQGPQQPPESENYELLFQPLPHPNDLQALSRYIETYAYDPVGNILKMTHQGSKNNWKRTYTYPAGSNRLHQTTAGSIAFTYPHDAHGNITALSHLNALIWNAEDQLSGLDLGGGGTAYYVYDAEGQRVRKVIERTGNSREECVYVGPFELFKKYHSGTSEPVCETIHVWDSERRLALVDTETTTDSDPRFVVRYQYNNHLGSAIMEADEKGELLSHEEYFPYGGTAYHALTTEISLKRYRFQGKERDAKSGLDYFGARFYVAWLSRWLSSDPAGYADGSNLYMVFSNNPVRYIDRQGTQVSESMSVFEEWTDAERDYLKSQVAPHLKEAEGSSSVTFSLKKSTLMEGDIQVGSNLSYHLKYIRDNEVIELSGETNIEDIVQEIQAEGTEAEEIAKLVGHVHKGLKAGRSVLQAGGKGLVGLPVYVEAKKAGFPSKESVKIARAAVKAALPKGLTPQGVSGKGSFGQIEIGSSSTVEHAINEAAKDPNASSLSRHVRRSAGRKLAKSFAKPTVKVAQFIGKSVGRFLPGVNIAVAGLDLHEAVRIQNDPSAPVGKKIAGWVTAGASAGSAYGFYPLAVVAFVSGLVRDWAY